MRLNVWRWVIVFYLVALAGFSFYLLNIPGRDYKVLTTSDSGYFAGIAEELNSRNGFIERYSRSHAPTGWPVGVQDQGQPLLAVMLYRGISAVFPKVQLMDVINIWSPLLFATFIFVVFLITRELAGDVAACAASFFASVLTGSIYWCKFAAFDREALVTVLSCWTIYLTILTFKHSSIRFAILAGLTYALLGLSWGGWLYLAPVLVASLLLLLLYEFLVLLLFKERRFLPSFSCALRQNFKIVTGLVGIFVTTSVVLHVFGSPPDWVGFARTLLGYLGIGGGGGGPVPASRYASEMAPPTSYGEILSRLYEPPPSSGSAAAFLPPTQVGDLLNRIAIILFAVGTMKILWTRRKWEWLVFPWLVVLMGLVWPGRGQARFDRLWWPFITVMAGVGVGAVVSAIKWVIKENPDFLRFLRPLPFLLILFALPFANNAVARASITTPPTDWAVHGLDQGLIETFRWLENNTPEDTTVAIEWSYGHLLTGTSKRRSVCDGVEVLAQEGKWENDPSFSIRPPDYIYYISGGSALIYGVDKPLLYLDPYRIYGRRTDILRIPYMDAAELEWLLRTYRDNFGVRIDYIVLDILDYWNASWENRNHPYFCVARSTALRAGPPAETHENLVLFRFGENENIWVNTATHTAYLERKGGLPDLLFDGYVEIRYDAGGNYQGTTFYRPPRSPDLNQTFVVVWVGGQAVQGAIYPSISKEIEERGVSIGLLIYNPENLPDFLEVAFRSSNYFVTLLRVCWDKIPAMPTAPTVPSGNWMQIETFQVSG